MANLFIPGAALAALAGAAILANQDSGERASQPVFSRFQEVQRNDTWRLENRMTDQSCQIEKTDQRTGAGSQVRLEPDCAGVFARSTDVASWKQDEFGNIILADGNDRAVVIFAFSEETGLSSVSGEKGALHLMPAE